jgi:hypothetical protein
MAEVEFEIEDYTVIAEVEWKYVGHNGIGAYEYWGSMYYDEGKPEYEIESIDITSVCDPDGNEIPISELSKDKIDLFEEWITERSEPEIKD